MPYFCTQIAYYNVHEQEKRHLQIVLAVITGFADINRADIVYVKFRGHVVKIKRMLYI